MGMISKMRMGALGLLVVGMVLCLVTVGGGTARAANEGTYTIYQLYDGWLSKTVTGAGAIPDGYDDAHDAASADIMQVSANDIVVGQNGVDAGGGTATYTVWRGMLYFDTIALPANAQIVSASVVLWTKEDNSTDDFDIWLVDGSQLTAPPTDTNYGFLKNAGTNLVDGTPFSTSGWVDNSAATMPLNSTGIALIARTGVTRMGIRSSLDVSATAPTVGTPQYCSFWSADGTYEVYTPKLRVTYLEADLGVPATFTIDSYSVSVFKGYMTATNSDTGAHDTAILFMYNVSYLITPSQNPRDYFLMQLVDSAGTVVVQGRLPAWGYRPAMLYASAGTGLTWEGDYTIRIAGDPLKFDAEDAGYNANYVRTQAISGSSWVGECHVGSSELNSALTQWILTTATKMGQHDGASYLNSTYGSTQKVNPAGQSLFLTGVPYLDIVAPDMFEHSEGAFQWPQITPSAHELGNWTHLGSVLGAEFENVGIIIFGYSSPTTQQRETAGKVVAGGLFAVLAVAIIGVVVFRTGSAPAGIICCFGVLLLGVGMGIYPPAIIAAIAMGVITLTAHQIWLRST